MCIAVPYYLFEISYRSFSSMFIYIYIYICVCVSVCVCVCVCRVTVQN